MNLFQTIDNFFCNQPSKPAMYPIGLEGVQKVPEIKLTKVLTPFDNNPITSSNTTFKLLAIMDLMESPIEKIVIIYMNKANKPLGIFEATKGGIDSSQIDFRVIFGVGLKMLATGFIVAHNHPSGKLSPSEQDDRLTQEIKNAGALLKFTLIDHLIVASQQIGYYSYADENRL